MSIRPKNRKRQLTSLLAVAGLIAITSVGGIHYTSQPGFCASCHEMQPLHSGWAGGSHAGTDCYACHVEPSFTGHVVAKVNGLRQVYTHLAGQVNLDKVQAEVPSTRCTRCHDMRDEQKFGARIVTAHLKHQEAKLECTLCHLTSGHKREAFVGFGPPSCQECHSAKPSASPSPYLRKTPCSR